ncbi:MAG: ATP-binding protein, partial [Pseudohongiellaceae bacterium]
MNFQPTALRPPLSNLPAGTRLRIALSGGLDSVVLLHALVTLRDLGALDQTLDAIHINHHINP